MTKKIRTLEDLKDISGTAAAELGLKTSKTKPVSTNKPTKKSTQIIEEIEPTKKSTKIIEEDDYGPPKPPKVNLDQLKDEPYPLRDFHRNLNIDEIKKMIDEAPARAAKWEKVYQDRVASGDNSIGYMIVSINTLREAESLKKYLNQLMEKAKNT